MTTTKWNFVPVELVNAFHDEQLVAHGGRRGTRDVGLLESALARPLNVAAYDEPDAAALAAEYAYGIAMNHPFVDGNKRTAFVTAATFMELNGYRFVATEVDVVLTFEGLAAGRVTLAELALWFRTNSTKV